MSELKCFLLLAIFGGVLAGCKSSTSPSNSSGNGPTVSFFTARPTTIDLHVQDSAELSWGLDGTQTSVSIDEGVGDQTNNSSDSVTVRPSATTTYTLTAKNSNGTSTKTVTVTVTNPSDPNSPPNPAQLQATGGSTSPSTINLSWTEPSGSVAATHFLIERHIAGQTFTDTLAVAAPGPGSYSDVQLFPTFVYYYRVKAVSSAGAASGWSNTAVATAPGQQPTISSISLTPTNVATLTPGKTQQFTAIAYDQSNNQLPLAQTSFLWSSDNQQVVRINGAGLATANTTQGSANIKASLPNTDGSTVSSNAVNLAVAAQSANTLVLFYGSTATDFTNYLAPLAASGVTYDKINDFSDGGDPQFTFDQIKGYSKIVVIQWNSYFNSAATSILAQYLDQGNKKLVIIAGDDGSIDGSTLGDGSHANISQGYQYVTDLNSTVQGQSGTAFAGFNFTLFNSPLNDAIQTTTFNGSGTAALIATRTDDQSQQIAAFQDSFSDGSSLLFSGITIDQVDAAHQNTYVKDFMSF